MESKRYYNESPQVTYLLEKIEEQNKEVQHWKGMCEELQRELDISNETNTGIRWSREYWKDRGEKLVDDIARFNCLPWYKKMFYKFKI